MKNVCKKTLIPALLVIILSGIARADDVELNKIVVTPSRIEESSDEVDRKVDVVTSREIEKSGAQDLAGALTGLTSVNISDNGGPGATKSIRMRGSTAAQVLVMVDGRPVNSPRDGQVDLSTIPLDNINQIEILHGPASSLYGAAGMGGAVNIITKNPPKEGQKTEVYSGFGTNHTFIDRLSQGARLGKFGYILSGSYESSGGFRDNSEFNSKDFNSKFEYELNNENNLFLNSGFYKSRVGAPGPLADSDIDNKQVDIKNFIDLGWNFSPDNTLGLKARIYNNHERLEFMPNSIDSVLEIVGPPFGDPTTKSTQSTDSRGLDIQFNKRLFDIYRFLCGFNYVGNFNDSTDSAKHRYTVRAWYLDNQLDLTKDLKLSLGARLDNYSNFGSQLSPNASFAYNLRENLKIRGSVGRSFRAPTFNDLYWPGQGNPNLKPEKGITEELGTEAKINKYLTSGLTYFHSDYKQLIQWSPDENDIWHPENVSSAIIDGIESENKIFISDNLDLNIDYTYLMARDDKTHKYLVYQPKNKVDTSLRYHDLNGLTVELKSQFTDQRFDDADNNTKVKSFFAFGLSVSKKFKPGLTCFASIDNLSNRKYQVIHDFPMPGFSFTGGLKAEF